MNTLLDKLNIDITKYPNLIIDTQGSELEVLKSFDDKLNSVYFIKTEVSLVPYYHGGVLFPELNNYLNTYNLYTKMKLTENADIMGTTSDNQEGDKEYAAPIKMSEWSKEYTGNFINDFEENKRKKKKSKSTTPIDILISEQ